MGSQVIVTSLRSRTKRPSCKVTSVRPTVHRYGGHDYPQVLQPLIGLSRSVSEAMTYGYLYSYKGDKGILVDELTRVPIAYHEQGHNGARRLV